MQSKAGGRKPSFPVHTSMFPLFIDVGLQSGSCDVYKSNFGFVKVRKDMAFCQCFISLEGYFIHPDSGFFKPQTYRIAKSQVGLICCIS